MLLTFLNGYFKIVRKPTGNVLYKCSRCQLVPTFPFLGFSTRFRIYIFPTKATVEIQSEIFNIRFRVKMDFQLTELIVQIFAL